MPFRVSPPLVWSRFPKMISLLSPVTQVWAFWGIFRISGHFRVFTANLWAFLGLSLCTDSIGLVDWSAFCASWEMSPSSRRQPSTLWRWRARRPHTHSALRFMVQLQTFSSLLASFHSLWSANLIVCEFLWALFPPGLGDQQFLSQL